MGMKQNAVNAARIARQNRRACSAFHMPGGGGRRPDDDGDGDPTEAMSALNDEEWRVLKGNLLMCSPLESLIRKEVLLLQGDLDGEDPDDDLILLSVLVRHFDPEQLDQLN
jgi:hypothetical protein